MLRFDEFLNWFLHFFFFQLLQRVRGETHPDFLKSQKPNLISYSAPRSLNFPSPPATLLEFINCWQDSYTQRFSFYMRCKWFTASSKIFIQKTTKQTDTKRITHHSNIGWVWFIWFNRYKIIFSLFPLELFTKYCIYFWKIVTFFTKLAHCQFSTFCK